MHTLIDAISIKTIYNLVFICSMLHQLNSIVAVKWLSISSLSTSSISGTNPEICGRIKGLERRQKKVCQQHIEKMPSIMNGAKLSIEECQHQFRNRRWNCSRVDKDSIFGNLTLEGTREAAYVHAVAAAGVSFAVTKACSRGESPDCGCDRSKTGSGGHFEWAGCSDNVAYGSAFSKTFTDAREKLKKANGRSLMNIHNNQAGRKVIENHMQMECKCHGVSGSCELRTCWRSLPQFRKVGQLLREAYDGAAAVKTKAEGSRLKLHQPMQRQYKPFTLDDLVYIKESPDFCERNDKLGTLGTQGRECNKTSTGTDGCDIMCCGRGFHTKVEFVMDRCNCKFHWCCHVQCEECRRKVERNICL